MTDPTIIVALDFPDADSALALSRRLSPSLCRLKVGKELFTAAGPSLVEKLVQSGFGIFLDLKFHDIPNTVAQACNSAARLGVWMLNIHALGGRAMLEAAREAIRSSTDRPLLTAVTILTSMGAQDLSEVGISGSPEDAVSRLAALTDDCGLDGVICSALEASRLRGERRPGFLLVTPGIRPVAESGAQQRPSDDQKRVMTPQLALAAGASYLVIGRPITRAPDPLAALRAIHHEIAA
ncbi:MAG TPA: orotidine-5'-phosphate decarboxylase [Burkholderiales bacterium]|nr:orotidine-5'-phosphate decarboxylase [Burkholderiales bacterium]